MTNRNKLIEVSLPPDATSGECAREESIRHSRPPALLEGAQVVGMIVDRSPPSLRWRDAGSPTGGPSFLLEFREDR